MKRIFNVPQGNDSGQVVKQQANSVNEVGMLVNQIVDGIQ